MSFRVLVIPEDPTWNGYILKPLAKRLLADAGRPAARAELLANPRLRGYAHARRAIREELPDSYGFFDLWLFFPDADRAGADAMRRLEADLRAKDIALLCCPAQPEVEIYACVAFRDDLPGTWEEARAHLRMKEEVFEPLLQTHGDPRQAGGGRELMNQEIAAESPAAVSVVPGDAASSRPDRRASPDSLTLRVPAEWESSPNGHRLGFSRRCSRPRGPMAVCRPTPDGRTRASLTCPVANVRRSPLVRAYPKAA